MTAQPAPLRDDQPVPVCALPPIRYQVRNGLVLANRYLRRVGYRLSPTEGNEVWLVGCHKGVYGTVCYLNWRAAYEAVRKEVYVRTR